MLEMHNTFVLTCTVFFSMITVLVTMRMGAIENTKQCVLCSQRMDEKHHTQQKFYKYKFLTMVKPKNDRATTIGKIIGDNSKRQGKK